MAACTADVSQVSAFRGAHRMADENFPALAKLPMVNWINAKYMGSVSQVEGHFRITFQPDKRTLELRRVKIRDYASLEEARQVAERIRVEYATEHGYYKNQIGYYYDNEKGERVGVCKLTQGQILVFDAVDQELVETYTWCAHLQCNTFYVSTNLTENEKRTKKTIQRFIYPDAIEIDHLNRIGADNRRINLDPTIHSINMCNTSIPNNNTSNIKGVCRVYEKARERWYCIYHKHNVEGLRGQVSFSPTKFGTNEKAHEAALTWYRAHAYSANRPLLCPARALSYWVCYIGGRQSGFRRKFNITKYGETGACRLAVEARFAAEQEHGYLGEHPSGHDVDASVTIALAAYGFKPDGMPFSDANEKDV